MPEKQQNWIMNINKDKEIVMKINHWQFKKSSECGVSLYGSFCVCVKVSISLTIFKKTKKRIVQTKHIPE